MPCISFGLHVQSSNHDRNEGNLKPKLFTISFNVNLF